MFIEEGKYNVFQRAKKKEKKSRLFIKKNLK